jgi:hypothetical protein
MKLIKVFWIVGLASCLNVSTAVAQQVETTVEEIDPVYLFNEMCFTQVPNVDQIQAMATRYAWDPMGENDLKQFTPLQNPDLVKGWDIALDQRIYRLGVVQSAPAAAFVESFPTFENGKTTSCSLLLDGQDDAAVILQRMNTLMRKEPATSDVPEGDLLATTWAGGIEDVKVFVVLKTDVAGSANYINVTLITR